LPAAAARYNPVTVFRTVIEMLLRLCSTLLLTLATLLVIYLLKRANSR